MADKPIQSPLAADLPENWSTGQIVAPAGSDVGLSQRHGYNYLMKQVNAAQEAVNTINNAFEGLASQEDLKDLNNTQGKPGGLATLGADGKLSDGQVPDASKVPYESEKLPSAANVKQALDSLQASVGKVEDAVLTYGQQTVQTTAWTEDQTLVAAGYGYRAPIPLEGMTGNHVPTVNFSASDASSGNMAPVADSYDGGVYIFAKAIPEAAVTIVSVEGLKGVNT